MKKLYKIFICFLVALMLVSVAPVSAQAASVTASTSMKKAPAVKAGHKYTVIMKCANKENFVKYKAPSAGIYKFTFTGMKLSSKHENLGNFYITKKGSYGPVGVAVKTEGGKTSVLYMTTKGWWNKYYADEKVTIGQYRYTRTAKVKLKKGQTVYPRAWATSGKEKGSYILTVKKIK